MVFSDGALTTDGAHRRFDHMLALGAELPFAKQPIVERSTNRIVGYSGVDRFELDGVPVLEWGWRLEPGARGKGYATEAGRVLLARAAETHQGEIIAMVDPQNVPSRNVAEKLGFAFWRRTIVDGCETDVHRLVLGGPVREQRVQIRPDAGGVRPGARRGRRRRGRGGRGARP
jgi:RimJ/RimL family protein N-acetyltransferase